MFAYKQFLSRVLVLVIFRNTDETNFISHAKGF